MSLESVMNCHLNSSNMQDTILHNTIIHITMLNNTILHYTQYNTTLHNTIQGLLHVPFARNSTMQSRAFSVVGPLVWNGLPLALRSLPRVFSQKFLQQLKTTLFGRAGVGS